MKYTCLLFFLCFSTLAFSQSKKEVIEQAKAYIAVAHYADALNVLESHRQLSKKDEEGRFLIAVCLYQLNDLSAAEKMLTQQIEEEKSPYPECWFYLGKIYHTQQQFIKAVDQYKNYLRLLRPDHANRAMVIQEIKRCDNGIRYRFREVQTVVENMGKQVNTSYDEFAPILSPNRSSQLYFTAIKAGNTGGMRNKNTQLDETYGQYLSDMFKTKLTGGQWQTAQPLHYLLNTPQHEQLIGFSNHGNVMLYYKGWTWENGEIFADTFQQEAQRSLKTTPFSGPARGNQGEQNFFLYDDTLLIFASRRPGGYGGYDLYKSVFKPGSANSQAGRVGKNSFWTAPENLGPTINSAFDETTPFLSRNGQTLYFSTNDSQKSVGGLDIVRSVYLKEAARWSTPENLGFPVNSPADDAHFILAKDGFTAFFSSSRKDGFGERDLYVAYFTKYRKEMESPVVTSFSPPPHTSSASVIIHTSTPETQPSNKPALIKPPSRPTASNNQQWSSQGSTLQRLNTDVWINQVVEAAGRNRQTHIIVSCYVPLIAREEKTKSLYDGMQTLKNISRRLAQKGIESSRVFLRALSSPDNQYHMIITMAPQLKTTNLSFPVIGVSPMPQSPINQSLVYKIQVIAVQRSISNAKISSQTALMLENAQKSTYLRYTMGALTTYVEAKKIRNEIIASGTEGAHIVAYLYGERIDDDQARQFVDQFPDLRQYLDR